MKKKILFCCYGFGIGGIEKCLISLLNSIDTDRYDIDVLPMNPEYDLIGSLKANVNILDPFDYVMNTTDTVTEFRKRKKGLWSYGKYVFYRVINKWGNKPWRLFKAPEKYYDIAIAYAHIGYVPFYVIDCIHAKRKYMWHHEGRYVISEGYALDKEYYPKFDSLVAVSMDDREVLLRVFPELEDKILVMYNIINKQEIKDKAIMRIPSLFDKKQKGICLVTVGRLSKQKGPDLLVEVCKRLKSDNISFAWYWVGDGDQREYLQQEIILNKLEDRIYLLGNQSNPYPYMNMADIYVQPSYYEAYCTTTIEAQILEKPIIVTDVCGMREQFSPGEDCIMVNVDANDIYLAVKELINDEEKRKQLSLVLKKKMSEESNVLQSYYELFDRE